MVIRLGRNGRFLACSHVPRAQGVAAAARRRAAAPGGRGRGLPQVRRGHAGRQERAVRAVPRAARATRTATTSRRRARRRPTRCRSRSSAPRTRTASSSRVARGAPATSSGGAPTTRSATSRRTTSRSAGCTTPTTGRWRARARRRSASSAARRATRRPTTSSRASATRAAPPNPEALARPARGRPRRWRVPAAVLAGRRRGGARGTTRRTRPTEPAAERVSAVAGDPATHPTLERFLRSLAARDASPAHDPCLHDGRGGLPRLARRARRGLARPDPARPARLPRPPRDVGRADDRRPAAGGHPLVPPLGGPRGSGRGRSVGRHRHAAAAAPAAAGPRGRPGRPAARRRR